LEERFDQLRVDSAGPVERRARVDEVLPLDDPIVWQRVGARAESQLAAQGAEREQESERCRDGVGVAAQVEIQVEVVCGPHHAVSEAVGGHGELQRHERLVDGIVELVAVIDNVVHELRIDDTFQEVVQDDVLVVLTQCPAGSPELLPLLHQLIVGA
jgi:hypothetical protein